jgi:hypothetical protein
MHKTKSQAVDRVRERREAAIRAEAAQRGYVKGLEDGRKEIRGELLLLLGLDQTSLNALIDDRLDTRGYIQSR